MTVASHAETLPPLVLDPGRPVHFIGMGGVGMSALAKVLLKQGFSVSGSDQATSAYLESLAALGAKTFVGHDATHVPNHAVVVASTSISLDNPERQAAEANGLPVYHRSALLAAILTQFSQAIGLCGTHGKTTMTGMAGLMLEAAGLDPTVIAGGKVPEWQSNARIGENTQWAVAELDESDGSIVHYAPSIAVIANLELDHPDHYPGGLEAIRQTMGRFIQGLAQSATLILNGDCPNTASLAEFVRPDIRVVWVHPLHQPTQKGLDTIYLGDAEPNSHGGFQARVYRGWDRVGALWLHVPGEHNLWNALFVATVGLLLNIPFETIRTSLAEFNGMGRRFEKLGQVQGAWVVDDYAHHPTEVQATLSAARAFSAGQGRVIAVFQPHRYQRLAALWDDFAHAFDGADEVILLDVYAAGDAPIPDVSSERLAQVMDHTAVEYWPGADWALIAARLKTVLTPGDVCLTMGAGDITQLGRLMVAAEDAAS